MPISSDIGKPQSSDGWTKALWETNVGGREWELAVDAIEAYTEGVDWQQPLALVVVAVVMAIALAVRWRRRSASICGGGCCPSRPSALASKVAGARGRSAGTRRPEA